MKSKGSTENKNTNFPLMPNLQSIHDNMT